jgi:hypothetical protein
VGQSLSQAEAWNDVRYADQSFLLVAAVALLLITAFRQAKRQAPLWGKDADGGDTAKDSEEKDEPGADGKTA